MPILVLVDNVIVQLAASFNGAGNLSANAIITQSVTYDFTDSKSGATSWTGVNLGTADASRIIIVAVSDQAGTPPTGVSVAGVTATKRVATTHANLWTAAVPTGTTGTITLTGSSSATLQGIGVYAMYNSPTEVPSDTSTTDTNGSVDVPANGCVIACASRNVSSGITWTGLTEDYKVAVGGVSQFSSASDAFVSAQTVNVGTTNATNLAIGAWG